MLGNPNHLTRIFNRDEEIKQKRLNKIKKIADIILLFESGHIKIEIALEYFRKLLLENGES